MKKIKYILIFFLTFISCKAQETPKVFSEAALNDTFLNLDGSSIPFKTILDANKGKTIVVDIWASWCGDCIKGMPKVKALQKQYKDAEYVFLSLDKTQDAWKKGIEKYEVKGQHYFMESGWKGPFGEFVHLDWIPRYMVIDKKGNIKLFKAIEADDKKITSILK
ncbi:TlpA family protein disulfide reductase [Mariniflexile sp.]|uniref:TlpA family protein disulfide reductase n=1 Tax=Mariniflexile sp. TaxID=1979402 RepID=UPI0040475ECA